MAAHLSCIPSSPDLFDEENKVSYYTVLTMLWYSNENHYNNLCEHRFKCIQLTESATRIDLEIDEKIVIPANLQQS